MNLERIKRAHTSDNALERLPRCFQCKQWWPCDAIQAVGRVEELEAALRDAAEVLRSARAAIEDEQMAHGCVDGKHPAVDEIDAVLASLPV